MDDIDFSKPATYFAPSILSLRGVRITPWEGNDYRVVLDLPKPVKVKKGDYLAVEFYDQDKFTLVKGRVVFKRGRRVHVWGGVYRVE